MSFTPSKKYLVITPCRDEAKYIQTTIDTMVAQTTLPACWVIVDDGSTDATPDILKAAAAKFPFIKIIHRKDRGARAVGPGVIEAFNAGMESVDLDDYDFLCKLDGDLGLPPKYFETLINYMEKDPLLGNLSGKTYIQNGSREWVSERMGDENAIGASKFYRVACFKDIGGFVRRASWDGIDGHRCRLKGWIAGSYDEEDLRLKHYRPQGSSQKGVWTGRLRWGRGKYFMGSSFIYVLAASIFRMFEYPIFVGGIGILCGYISAMLEQGDRYGDTAYLRFFRRYELSSLLIGKKRTLRNHNKKIRERALRLSDYRLA